ncbi:MAG: spore cortex biosynthesis protein YabQ [Bacillota bacterium]|jgi:hypothetical protein
MQFMIYQGWVLLAAILCGVLLGLFLDFYRAFSRRWYKRKYLLHLFDFLFWLTAFIALFSFWYFLTPGGMRPLLIVFLLVGFALYHSYLSVNFGDFLHKKPPQNPSQPLAQILPPQKEASINTSVKAPKENSCQKVIDKGFYTLAIWAVKGDMRLRRQGKRFWQKMQQKRKTHVENDQQKQD